MAQMNLSTKQKQELQRWFQWLRLWAPNAGGPVIIPGQGTKSHILQLRTSILMVQWRPKVLCAAINTLCGQINKILKKKKKTDTDS